MGPPEQRSQEATKMNVRSTQSLNRGPSTQHTTVPLYMTARAEAAAVKAPSQQVKRRLQEEDGEGTRDRITKQIKPDPGLKSMTPMLTSLTLHASSRETNKTRDGSPAVGKTKKALVDLNLGDCRVVLNQTENYPLKRDKTGIIIIEVKGYDQGKVMTPGSRRVTLRKRKFPQKMEKPAGRFTNLGTTTSIQSKQTLGDGKEKKEEAPRLAPLVQLTLGQKLR